MPAIDIHAIREAAGATGLAIEVADEAGSTNRVLMDAPFGQAPSPARLLAVARQTAGRGRQGRGWVMEPGRSAAFSVAVERCEDPAGPAVGLSIAVGVAAAEALADFADGVGIKWPNDLQRAGHKLGGVLVESRRGPAAGPPLERYVVGIGLNLLTPRDGRCVIGQPVAGLFDGETCPLPAERVIGRVAAAVAEAAGVFFREGLAPFADGWHRLDRLRGRQVVVLSGGRVEMAGLARGIDDQGALLLDTGRGLATVRHGEVSVRAVPDGRPLAEA